MASQLEQAIAGIAEALQSSHSSVRHGDKAVQYRSARDLEAQLRVARQLDEDPPTLIVMRARRPKL